MKDQAKSNPAEPGTEHTVQALQQQLERLAVDFRKVYKLLAGQRRAHLEGMYRVMDHYPLSEYARTDPERSARIGEIAVGISQAYGKSEDFCEIMRYAVPMCELDQFEANQKIQRILELAKEIAGHLHENFDGSGYLRLKQKHIPLAARIALVAHGFYACQAGTPFGYEMSEEEALKVVRKGAGARYDPEVVDSLARALIIKRLEAGAVAS